MGYETTGQESVGMTASQGTAIILRPTAEPPTVPALIADAGDQAARRFLEFFAANIRNPNTRAAYAQAVLQFLDWCQALGLGLRDIEPVAVAAYIESLQRRDEKPLTAPSVKQHLAAIRTLFDWLVVGQVVSSNPAVTPNAGPKPGRRREGMVGSLQRGHDLAARPERTPSTERPRVNLRFLDEAGKTGSPRSCQSFFWSPFLLSITRMHSFM
jgi:site-specific recombinase XerD